MTEHWNGEFVEVADMAPPAAAARGVKHLRYRGNSAPVEQGDGLSSIRPWPVLSQTARRGLAGDFAKLATKHSEADQVAVMLSMLTAVGALMGRARYTAIGEDHHHARFMSAAVGATGRARKGTSWRPVSRLVRAAEFIIRGELTVPYPLGNPLRIDRGPLSSGEGLVEAVRDKTDPEDKSGTDDKRLLVVEGELGAALRSMQRQGNTLSMILRGAWDGDTIAPLVRHNRVMASDPHVCIIAHVTREELSRLLAITDVWGGLVNRFLWACVRRGPDVPHPVPMDDDDLACIAGELARVTVYACSRPGVVCMSKNASDHWGDIYPELTQHRPGLFGAATARAEAQVLRLALTYALIDGEDCIDIGHLEAALAMWRYCQDSAAFLFGGVETDPVSSRVLEALRSKPAMTNTDLQRLFSGHRSTDLKAAMAELQALGTITMHKESSGDKGGRPRQVWRLATKATNEK